MWNQDCCFSGAPSSCEFAPPPVDPKPAVFLMPPSPPILRPDVSSHEEAGNSDPPPPTRLPRDAERRKMCIQFVNRPNWEPSKYNTVCSKHFLPGYIDRTSLSCVRLRHNAIPTIDGFQVLKVRENCKIRVLSNIQVQLVKCLMMRDRQHQPQLHQTVVP